MENRIQQYAAEHRYLLDMLRRELGFADPIALDLDEFQLPLVKGSQTARGTSHRGSLDPRLGPR